MERIGIPNANDPAAPLTWGAEIVVGQFNSLNNWQLTGGTRAFTVPRMRYNPTADRVVLTWHGTPAPLTGNTQIYFTSRPADPAAGGWTTPLTIDAVAGRDLFFSALDSDPAGNVLVGWYDRRNDANNVNYQYFVRYVTGTGGATALGSQPLRRPNNGSTETIFASSPIGYFIGDYHAIWRWNGRWNIAFIGRPTNTLIGDTYVAQVQ